MAIDPTRCDQRHAGQSNRIDPTRAVRAVVDDEDYFCPFCHKNCGPDYSDYSDHVYDEHPERAGVRQSWA